MLDIFECNFTVSVVNMPRCAGRSQILNLVKDLQTKQCIVEIKNADSLCTPRAIVTGLTYFNEPVFGKHLDRNEIKQVCIGRDIQKKLSLELCRLLGDYNEEGFTLENMKKCEQVLDV